MKKKLYYILVQSDRTWRTISKTYDRTTLERTVADLRFKSHVAVTTWVDLGRKAGTTGVSNKVIAAAYERDLVKVVQRVPEPEVMRISIKRVLGGNGFSRGRQIMSLMDAVDLLWSSPKVLAFLKSVLRRELAAGRSFRTKSGIWRVVGPEDDLQRAKKIVYVRKSRFGAFLEKVNR